MSVERAADTSCWTENKVDKVEWPVMPPICPPKLPRPNSVLMPVARFSKRISSSLSCNALLSDSAGGTTFGALFTCGSTALSAVGTVEFVRVFAPTGKGCTCTYQRMGGCYCLVTWGTSKPSTPRKGAEGPDGKRAENTLWKRTVGRKKTDLVRHVFVCSDAHCS